MRILYIPFFSNRANHNGCSVYNAKKVIFRQWVEADEDVFVYFLLPKNIPYEGEEILSHPRIKIIPIKAFNSQYDEQILLPEEVFEFFNVNTGEVYYDAIVCDKVRIANFIKLLLEDKNQGSGYVPLFTFSHLVTKMEGRFAGILEKFESACALGWIASHNIFENKRHFERSMDIARKYLTPFFVKRIMENSFYGNLFGVDTKRLEPKYKGNDYKKGDELIINYAHRLATHYNPMFVLDVVDKIYSSGQKVKLVITTPNAVGGMAVQKRIKEMQRKGLPIEIFYGLNQEKYYEVASKCHLFITAIEETESANSIFEQICLGQVGIFPEYDWVKKFLPDYPYHYKNLNEAYMWVKEFLDNPEPMKAKSLEFKKMIEENWNTRQNSEELLKWVKAKVAEQKVPQGALDTARQIMETAKYPEVFDIDGFAQIFKQCSESGIDIGRKTYSGYNKFDWIKAIKQLGYRDTLKSKLSFEKIK